MLANFTLFLVSNLIKRYTFIFISGFFLNICFWLHWVFAAVYRLCVVAAKGDYSRRLLVVASLVGNTGSRMHQLQ